MKKTISSVLILVLLSGCATMDDHQTTQAQGAGFGAAAGAVIGGLIGLTASAGGGSKSKMAGKGAAIGALAGGALGTAYGTNVALKKHHYAGQEDYLEACIAQAMRVRSETEAFNSDLQREVAGLEKRYESLLAEVDAGQERREELNVLRIQSKTRLADAEKAMEKLNVELELQRQILAEERSNNPAAEQLAKLQDTIQALEAEKIQLQQRTQRLAAINNRMSV